MMCIVVACVQIQYNRYNGVYPTKTWCDTVSDLCSVYIGEIVLTLTLYPSQLTCLKRIAYVLLSSSIKHAMR